MESPYFFLLFFGIFLLIGGSTIGRVLRSILARQFGFGLISAFLSGALFSLVPLVGGALYFNSINSNYLFIGLLFVWIGAMLVTALAPDEALDLLGSRSVVGALVGVFMLLLALFLFPVLWSEGAPTALLITGFLILFGGVMVASSIGEMRKAARKRTEEQQ